MKNLIFHNTHSSSTVFICKQTFWIPTTTQTVCVHVSIEDEALLIDTSPWTNKMLMWKLDIFFIWWLKFPELLISNEDIIYLIGNKIYIFSLILQEYFRLKSRYTLQNSIFWPVMSVTIKHVSVPLSFMNWCKSIVWKIYLWYSSETVDSSE